MKKLFVCLLALLMLMLPGLAVEAGAAEIIDSGSCGENVTWTLDSDGLLTISGTGSMADYHPDVELPWPSSVKTAVIEDGVTTIGDHAFWECSDLTGITIPDSVTEIGDYAFYECRGLTGIALPESIERIGEGAFGSCWRLADITLPEGVKTIGKGAFDYCDSLVSIHIPKSVESIGADAFKNCGMLTEVYITDVAAWLRIAFENRYANPLAVHGIDNSYMDSVNKLYLNGEPVTELVIPEGVTAIGDYAFYQCGGITHVTVREGVTEIGDYAFWQCIDLTDVNLLEGVENIGQRAFENCGSLVSIHLPGSVKSIGAKAFDHCDKVTDVYIADVAAWLNIAFDPEYANPLTLNSMDKNLYLDGQPVTELVIPEGVTAIGEDAFLYCSGITHVTIPEGVESIGASAFAACTGLTDVTIPASVAQIGSNAFHYCSELKNVYISDVAAWLNIAFDNEYANPLEANGRGKLLYLDGKLITDLVIPEGVTHIGNAAFRNCFKITSVTVPDSVTGIGSWAFYDCSGLTRVTGGKNVTAIGDQAFGECINLADFAIPEGVTGIGKWAFHNCESLTGITLPEGITDIAEGAFSGCTGLTRVTIPEGVEEIRPQAFSFCSGMTAVLIPESVTDIWEYAFSGCPLTDVYYAGSQDAWTEIYIDSGNDSLTGAKRHYQVSVLPPEETQPEETQPQETTPDDDPDDDFIVDPEETKPRENPFNDVGEDAYYYEPVLWAVEKGITTGMSENTFAPDATCTRGQIVTFLWRAKGSPEPQMAFNPFSDVSNSDYFYKAVLWAVEKGITSGMGDGTFAPAAPCTRGQVATFLWRAEGKPEVSAANAFTDVAQGAYYYDAVLWAVEKGITNGMGDGTFAPDAPCTRGQIVTFLYRAMA